MFHPTDTLTGYTIQSFSSRMTRIDNLAGWKTEGQRASRVTGERWLPSCVTERQKIGGWMTVGTTRWLREWQWMAQGMTVADTVADWNTSETGLASCMSRSDVVGYLNTWMIDFSFAEWLEKMHNEYFNILQHIQRWLTGKRLNYISVPTWLASQRQTFGLVLSGILDARPEF
jgi:hypothetical protein